MRNALMVMAATIALAAPVIRSVRIDRPKASASGTLLVDVSDRVMSVATDVLRAWPVLHNTAVLYTRERAGGELQLRLFDAPSTMSHTVATVPYDVVDLTEESQPGAHSIFILTMRDDSTGNPSLAVVSDGKGVLYREDMAAPGTLANGVLQVRRYTKEEIQRSGGDLMKARPFSVDPLALSSVLR